jgi:iron complex transport system substrate-binding protein
MKRSLVTTLIVVLALLISLAPLSARAETPKRIVSLAPQITEMLYALGLGDNIVGVTIFCDYPPEARQKPKIGGMSNPSLEEIVALKPDLVIMTTDGNPKEIEPKLHSLGLRTHVIRARRLEELPGAIERLGAALDVGERAEALAGEIRAKLDSYGKIGRAVDRRLKVLFVVWPEPLIVAGGGTVIDDGIRLLGHVNIASESAVNYPKYSLEEVLAQAPDVILVGGMGQRNMEKVSARLLERLHSTPAARSGSIYFVGDGLMRYGPRVVEGMDEIVEVFEREASR